MSTNRPATNASQSPRRGGRFPIVGVLIGLVVLGVVLAGGGFAFAASQEGHDSFCASCHSQPESTFYQRSVGAQPTDLASFHTTKTSLCIDCHSGVGLVGRLQAETMGARNAVLWYTGTATQPAPMTYAIQDSTCLKCHQDVTQQRFVPKESTTIPGASGGREGEGRSNHWHTFMTRWQAATPNAGACVSCHPGHSTNGTAQTGFQSASQTTSTCDACHSVLREREGRD